jgi:aspartate kinase
MKVLKFGGTSVGTPDRIKYVAELIAPRGRNIVVLSAMAGTTNTLVEIADYLYKKNLPGAQETLNNLEMKYECVVDELFSDNLDAAITAQERVDDYIQYVRSLFSEDFTDLDEREILARGELISTALMEIYLRTKGIKAVLLPALEFMRTRKDHEPDMPFITTRLKRLLEREADADIYITQGYICRNSVGEIDNLQRGGSDYTASLIGAAIGADEIEIWTDIDGMHNNDPRFVEGTKPVKELHFEEAAELAYFGAKILHPACVLPARLHNIPIRLLNTLEPEKPGTLIYNTRPTRTIKAVAAKDNITAIKIKSGRLLVAYGFLHRVFETFENHHTSIDMMATSEVGVTVAVDNDGHLAEIVDELKKIGTVTVDTDMVILCIAGDLEWHNAGFEAKAVSALGDIPIRMISYGGSNYNISMLVRREDKVEAMRRLSAALFNDPQ